MTKRQRETMRRQLHKLIEKVEEQGAKAWNRDAPDGVDAYLIGAAEELYRAIEILEDEVE